jgi:hypothetical protein
LMAENIQETRPPEPPPKPPEVPSPIEQPNRSKAEDHGQPNESQQSAQQDTRNAAHSAHALATSGREPDGLRPTPDFQVRLDAHTAAKAEHDTAAPQDSAGAQRPQGSSAAQRSRDSGSLQRPQDSQAAQRLQEATVGDGNTAAPAGEQAGEHAAAREAAAAEWAKAIGDTAPPGEPPLRPQPIQDADPSALDNGQPRDPDRATQLPERSRHDDPVPALPPEGSATAQQPADQTAPQQTAVARGPADGEQARPAEAEALNDSTPLGETPTGNNTGENPPEDSYSDPVDDLRDQPQNTPPDNTETDKAAEAAARLTELRDEGHGPQRHHDPTNEQLAARMGDPILDPQTGQPELKGNGHVKAQNHIDPMTGTTVDGVHGGMHRCGDYATRFDSAEDYVAADRFMRSRVSDNQPVVKAPISDVLGPDGHDRVTGYYRDPAAPGELKPVDFTGGNIVAVYNRDVNGTLTLYTMYPDPVPFHPNQPGGTAQ